MDSEKTYDSLENNVEYVQGIMREVKVNKRIKAIQQRCHGIYLSERSWWKLQNAGGCEARMCYVTLVGQSVYRWSI